MDAKGVNSVEGVRVEDRSVRQESCVTEQSMAELRWRPAESVSVGRRERTFLSGLGKDELFYCCRCYQYVFEVERERHFPSCRDSVTFREGQAVVTGWERLERLVELARYTGTNVREVEDLWGEVEKGVFYRMLLINTPKQCTFFTLA